MEFGFEEKEKNNIKEAIIRVIAFFDMFDFPLTVFEIWKYLGEKCDLAEVMDVLNNLTPALSLVRRGGNLESKDGFYFLPGRSDIIDTRIKRYNYADKKFKRAVFIARIFKIIPWIKMIAVGNIIGGNNAKKESDIDLFIITDKKRVWLTRFFSVVMIKFFGLRPHGLKMRDTICLSFFVSEGAMDLQELMLGAKRNIYAEHNQPHPGPLLAKERGTKNEDIYFIYWLASLEPIYDRDETYKKFIGVNRWIYGFLPSWQAFAGTNWRDAGQPLPFLYRDILDLFFGGLEKNFKNWQIKRLPSAIKEIMNKDTRVIATDDILKFHVNDRREYYKNLYLEKLEKGLKTAR